MPAKYQVFNIQGMNRDLAVSMFNPKFAYENKNLRLRTVEDNSLLELTNEKGPKEISGIEEDFYFDQNKPFTDTFELSYDDIEESYIINGRGIEYFEKPVDDEPTANYPYTITTEQDEWNPSTTMEIYFPTIGKSYVINPESESCGILVQLTAHNTVSITFTSEIEGTDSVTRTTSFPDLSGIPIGTTVINNNIVVFTTSETTDRIYKYWIENNILKGKLLVESSNLDFDEEHPIETLTFFENEDIQKVYWVDGKNQLRVINISASSNVISKLSNKAFNVTPYLKLKESVTIERVSISGGSFPSGTIQYCFTYYNQYMQESNIFYTSPLYYLSYSDRGASAESSVSNAFKITIENPETDFDYVRVYSIIRTSVDSIPTVKRVVDLPISPASSLTYVDNGLSGDIEDPTVLLYVGGTEAVFGTITQKDNTLFLGDYTLKTQKVSSDIKNFFRGQTINFSYKDSTDMPNSVGYYPYNNGLRTNSEIIKTFKYRETYRFGVQFQDITGKWSEPIWIKDVKNEDKYPMTNADDDYYLSGDKYKLAEAVSTINIPSNSPGYSFIQSLINQGFRKIRPLVVYPTLYDREVLCQGVLCPTVYNVGDRANNSPFAQSSWFSRPNAPHNYQEEIHIWIDGQAPNAPSDVSIVDTNMIYLQAQPTKSNEDPIKDSKAIIVSKVIPLGDYKYEIIGTGGSHNSCFSGVVFLPKLVNNATTWVPVYNYTQRIFRYGVETDSEKGQRRDTFVGEEIGASIQSRAGAMSNEYRVFADNTKTYPIDEPNYGAWAEFRHNCPIPNNERQNAEIQCLFQVPDNPYIDKDKWNGGSESVADWVSNHQEYFYVDQSIITLHSPDIEFDDTIQSFDFANSEVKLRIVGMIPFTANAADTIIETSTPPNQYLQEWKTDEYPVYFERIAPGFRKEPIGSENISRLGWRGLISAPLWYDAATVKQVEKKNIGTMLDTYAFVVYPWHRNGSLNNTKTATDGSKSAMLSQKRLSNLKYSYNTKYFLQANADPYKNIWYAEETNSEIKTGISGVTLINSSDSQLFKIPAPKNSELGDITYYSTIDKVVTPSVAEYSKREGYPIMVSGWGNIDENVSAHELFREPYKPINTGIIGEDNLKCVPHTSNDAVRIRYKSTPHAVLALNYAKSGQQRVLPTIKDQYLNVNTLESWTINSVDDDYPTNKYPFWYPESMTTSDYNSISQDVVDGYCSSDEAGILGQFGFLWLGELYRDNITNRFGGTTDEAFENNQWVPCGEPIDLADTNGNPKTSFTIKWSEGDTYYMRYDNLKTYPYSFEDQNQITEIMSFMVETHVNLDGRYDRNRGQVSNLAISPTNFNLLNKIYSQTNNYFNYRWLSPNKLTLDNFRNTVTWTKTKSPGELVDTWTNITLASNLDLDGDKGYLRALRRFNNEIIAFQDRGISQILYNENVQINTANGVPVELANSGKVQGKRYLANSIGCYNKWSITESPSGLYFIDDINRGIYIFNGQFNSLSDSLGFNSWVQDNAKISIWNPKTFANTISYYDSKNREILFITDDECLAYSESLNAFTSFYSYEYSPYLINCEGNTLWIRESNDKSKVGYRFWEHNKGDYNTFFDSTKPYYTTIIANNEFAIDKVWNTVEFRADVLKPSTTKLASGESTILPNLLPFDHIQTYNEYQDSGKVYLTNLFGKPSNLKQKFRTWRANIPRDSIKRLDRMRNPWLTIKLSKEALDTNKTVLHDIIVHYFD